MGKTNKREKDHKLRSLPTPPPIIEPWGEQNTEDAAGKGVGSRYNPDGTKKELGVEWGP